MGWNYRILVKKVPTTGTVDGTVKQYATYEVFDDTSCTVEAVQPVAYEDESRNPVKDMR